MDVKKLFLSAALAATVGSHSSFAANPNSTRMETIAPTVTQASCTTNCDVSCDSTPCGCDAAGGGLFSRLGLGSRTCGAGCDSSTCCDANCELNKGLFNRGLFAGGCDSCGGCGSTRGCGGSGCGDQGFGGCDGNDCGGCDGLSAGCDAGLLGYGWVKRSDQCFDDFISPMTNSFFFEDPRTLTEARFIFMNNQLPNALGGNSLQVYAMQARVALTQRLSLIATKNAIYSTQSPLLDSGFADGAFGFKYNLYRDVQRGRLLSAGITFDVPTGAKRTLQGNGNGEYHFFTTAGTRIGSRGHWLIASGLREPADKSLENRLFYVSNHLDRRIGNRALYAFTELNWYNYGSSANAFAQSIEGGDLFNLGSPNVTGNDLVTHAIGLKSKPRSNMEAGVAWEYPMTARDGLMDNRLTADFIVRY